MSGMMMSTPSNSASGKVIPQSTINMWSPNSKAIMFIPNSPKPPSGMARNLPLVSEIACLLTVGPIVAYLADRLACAQHPTERVEDSNGYYKLVQQRTFDWISDLSTTGCRGAESCWRPLTRCFSVENRSGNSL